MCQDIESIVLESDDRNISVHKMTEISIITRKRKCVGRKILYMDEDYAQRQKELAFVVVLVEEAVYSQLFR